MGRMIAILGLCSVLCATSSSAQESDGPILSVTPTSFQMMDYSYPVILDIENLGTGTLEWEIHSLCPWWGARDMSLPQDDRAWVSGHGGLEPGKYTGSVLVTSNGGYAIISGTMYAGELGHGLPAIMDVSPPYLDLGTTDDGGSFEILGLGEELTWTLETTGNWLTATPTSGTGNGTVTVSANRSGLEPGLHGETVRVSSNGGGARIYVQLEVPPPPPPPGIGVMIVAGDPTGRNCALTDDIPGLVRVYIVHLAIDGSTASQFWAPMPDCMVGVEWIGDSSPYPVFSGDSQTGISISYGGCLPGPIHVLTVNYFGNGQSTPCCEYPVLPHPDVSSGRIEAVDCAENLIFVDGGEGIVNVGPLCPCVTTPTQMTTWGGVKALYSSER